VLAQVSPLLVALRESAGKSWRCDAPIVGVQWSVSRRRHATPPDV